MKLIYLHQYFATPQESGGTRSYELGRRLVKMGWEVHIVTSRQEVESTANGWSLNIIEGMHVHSICVPYNNKYGFWKRIQAFLSFSWHATLKSIEIGGDIVFATSTPLTIAIPGVFSSWVNHIPMVFEVRDLWPDVPIAMGELKGFLKIKLAKYLESFAYLNSSRIVALSPGMKNGIIKWGYNENKIEVIPNFGDIELWSTMSNSGTNVLSELNIDEKHHVIVYAGTFGAVNNISELLKIAAHVKYLLPKAIFILIGDGREGEKLKKEAIELDLLCKNVFFIQKIPKMDLPDVYSIASVTISFVANLKELWNNSANKVFDSFAAGRPVVINHGGWLANLLTSTGAGLVLPPGDPKKAADLLVAHLRNTSWLSQARQASRRLAETRFNSDLSASQLDHVLRDALGDR